MRDLSELKHFQEEFWFQQITLPVLMQMHACLKMRDSSGPYRITIKLMQDGQKNV